MLIGITGGIGMGKTTVLRDFVQLGGSVVDSDEIAHGLYLPGSEAYGSMVSHFGGSVLGTSGQIDRQAVGAIVFSDPEELAWLNGLLHPLIRSELKGMGRRASVPLYCAVPLLYESGWEGDMDVVVSVWCSSEVQRQRLRERGWSESEIDRRLASQLPADEKLRRSDYGIISDCSWSELHSQCEAVHRQVLGLSSASVRRL